MPHWWWRDGNVAARAPAAVVDVFGMWRFSSGAAGRSRAWRRSSSASTTTVVEHRVKNVAAVR